MCRCEYTERGIKELMVTFMSERWADRAGPDFTKTYLSLGLLAVLARARTTGPLKAGPARCERRADSWGLPARLWPRLALIGMLAAMIGVEHGLDVDVLDGVDEGTEP